MNNKFQKLIQLMGQPKGLSNPDLDEEQAKRLEAENHLARIDEKIAELEASDDPNALESLNFWKQKRNELMKN